MNGYKVRIALFELMGDSFVSLIDFDKSCKENGLKPTLKKLVEYIEDFINENSLE